MSVSVSVSECECEYECIMPISVRRASIGSDWQ